MASIYYNPHVPGELARTILVRVGNKQFYARPRLPSSKPPTPSAVLARQRFGEAMAYAKGVNALPARRTPYAEAPLAPGERVFTRIVTDFLRDPVIRFVDTSGYHGRVGDPIGIELRDNLPAPTVTVEIRRASGGLVEAGEAANDTGPWRFVATAAVPAGEALNLRLTVADADSISIVRMMALVVA